MSAKYVPYTGSEKDNHECAVCGEPLKFEKIVWLEMTIWCDYYRPGKVPAGEESQGVHAVGSGCAKVKLAESRKR